ncbi:MAG: HAD family hydrolase [bacterium]|nr:MAG: HAD family hydrolase [bacterium]
MENIPKPAVFLDRDGTVCEEVGYLSDIDQLRLIPTAAKAIGIINQADWKTIIVSNQSGIARGYMTAEVVDQVNRQLLNLLQLEGVKVDGIYYCPHHPQGLPPFDIDCACRKPGGGMLQKAAREHQLALDRSIIIGDKVSDVETGQQLNIPGILVRTGFGEGEIKKYQHQWQQAPDYIARDILDAIQWWFNGMTQKPDSAK